MNGKGEWINIETRMMAERHGNIIEEVILDNPNASEMDLMALVSEACEHEIVENQLIHITEGYISDIIHESFKSIDYRALVRYHKS